MIAFKKFLNLRVFLILFSIVVLLLIAVSATAWFLVDSNRIRIELGRQIGRNVEFKSISPGLLAIKIDRLVISDTNGFNSDSLIECDKFSLKYSIFSLFTGRLLVNNISLTRPIIHIEFDTSGHSNVEDILSKKTDKKLFDVKSIEVDEGKIILTGFNKTAVLSEVKTELFNMNGSTSIDGSPWFVKSNFNLNGAPVGITGRVTPATLASELKITAKRIALDFAPIPDSIMDPKGLTLDLDAEVGYAADSVSFKGKGNIQGLASLNGNIVIDWRESLRGKGNISIIANTSGLRKIVPLKSKLDELEANGDLSVTVKIDGPLDKIPESVSGEFLSFDVRPPGFTSCLTNLRGAFSITPLRLTLTGVTLNAAGSPMTVSGFVLLSNSYLDLSLKSSRVELEKLLTLVKPSPLPPTLSVSGPARIDIALKGTSPDISATGTIELLGAVLNLTDPKTELSSINGNLKLSGSKLLISNMNCNLGRSLITADGTIDRAKETLDINVAADRLTLADIPIELGSERLKMDGTASFKGKVFGKLIAPGVDGRISADHATLFSVPITEMFGLVRYDGEKILVKELKAKALEGAVSGDVSATLAGNHLPFTLSLDLAGVSLPNSIRTITGSNAISGGIARGKLTLSGDGTNVSTYFGDGSITAEQISISAMPIFKTMSSVMGISANSLENFSGGNLVFTIRGGKLLFSKPLTISNQNIDLRFSGGIGLDGSISEMNILAGVKDGLLPSAISGIPLSSALGIKKENGKTYIPLKCIGSITSPTLVPDIDAGRAVTNIITDKLGVDLNNVIGNHSQNEPDVETNKDKSTTETHAVEPEKTSPSNPLGIITDILKRRR
ncbi:MAG: hypothetical protein COS94_07070 [Candidatus Hydrogenedentes bacterium CG07_land_8_20_14_0_80_42_17]|nr:MAG: hypothetical protein COS94_07070 [Candidatus Hydrogenedentes bacterium CG07_land_8_20_14_0_80_42_17]